MMLFSKRTVMAHIYLAYKNEHQACPSAQKLVHSTDAQFLLQKVRQECLAKNETTFFVISYMNGSEHRELSYVANLSDAIEFCRRYSQDGMRVDIESRGQTPGLIITEWDMCGFDNLAQKNLLHNIYTGKGDLIRSFSSLCVVK